MSEAYDVEGVTLTPQGGGWYELSHPSLAEPVKEHGKEVAEARAKLIAAGVEKPADEGSMPPQPSGLDAPALLQDDPALAEKDDEIANLKAQLADTDREKSALARELEIRTVKTTQGETPEPPSKVPAGVPRKYDGILDDKAKAELKRLGVETTEIILEENESIPPTGLFLGHNGRGYNIVPGEPVTVPNFLLGVLNDAVMSAPVVDAKSQKVLGYRNRMKYPYRKV